MLASIYGPNTFVVLVVVLLILGMALWAVIDIASRPPTDFSGTGLNKSTWLALTVGLEVAALFLQIVGLVAAGFVINYLFRVRPKLRSRGRTGVID
jgi:hypothetical protein